MAKGKGVVVGFVRRKGSTARLHVASGLHECCCIEVGEYRTADGSPVEIGEGDSVWWSDPYALMWTPKDSRRQCKGYDCNVEIPILGSIHHCNCHPIPEPRGKSGEQRGGRGV